MKNLNTVVKYIIGLAVISFCVFLLLEITAPPNFLPYNNESRIEETSEDHAHSIYEEFVHNINGKYYIIEVDLHRLFKFVYLAFFVQFVYTLLFIILFFIIPRLKRNGKKDIGVVGLRKETTKLLENVTRYIKTYIKTVEKYIGENEVE